MIVELTLKRVKNIADAILFTPEVCVEAPQTSADPIGEPLPGFLLGCLSVGALRHARKNDSNRAAARSNDRKGKNWSSF